MKTKSILCVLVTVGICVAGTSLADDVRELVVFKGNGNPVNWLAFSADGTRLAVAMEETALDKKGKQASAPGRAVVWDVESGKQVSVCQNPRKGEFTRLWLSADGKTLVTAERGATHAAATGDSFERLGFGVGADGGYQAWDAASGKTIGSRIAPTGGPHEEYGGPALSADGRYFAIVITEYGRTAATPLNKPFQVGEVRVWDMRTQTLKWKSPGTSHTGPVNWSDSLAFSPDGTRLAHYISGLFVGPTMSSGPDRRQTVKPLKLLTLEPGKSTPGVTAVEKKGIPSSGTIQWPSDGKSLYIRELHRFDALDPATGDSKTTFKLLYPFPQSDTVASEQGGGKGGQMAQKGGNPQQPGMPGFPPRPPPMKFPPPNNTQPPNVGGNPSQPPTQIAETDLPPGWHEPEATLSADGARFAAVLLRDRKRIGIMEYRAAIWDVNSKRLLGTIRLPDADNSPVGLGGDPFGKDNVGTHGEIDPLETRYVRIALSGDGKRLAVSDANGTVRVYDITSISGEVKPASKQSEEDVAVAAKAYNQAVEHARKEVLSHLDETIKTMSSGKDKTDLALVKDERTRFEKHGIVPWTQRRSLQTVHYLSALALARTHLRAAFGGAEIPADLRDLMEKHVVARWKHDPTGEVITLYANGRLKEPQSDNTWNWVINVGKGWLEFRWKDTSMAEGVRIEKCAPSADGLSYSGTDQKKNKVSGSLVKDG